MYQEVDDVPAFEPVTKYNATVDAVERIPDMVRQAFREAVSGVPGPVHLQFAGNEAQLDAAESELDTGWDDRFSSVPPFRPGPRDDDVRDVLRVLSGAVRPVIVAGGGVRSSRASDVLVQFAERAGLPVATSLNGKDVIPADHPLSVGVVGTYSRAAANRVVSAADVVFFVGTSTGGMTTHFFQVPGPGVTAVQLDIDSAVLGRNYPLTAGIQADARNGLSRLLELSEEVPRPRPEWLVEVARIGAAWRDEWAPLLQSDAVPIRPERICAELTAAVPDDGVVVVDTGHSGMWMGGMFDITSPAQDYIRSAGHLGWAFPASLGAKCAAPDRPVVCFTGDAGLWYHIGEIETAVRRGINTVTIVNNNSSGNQSTRGFDRAYGGAQTDKARELWTFNDVDFARIAHEMGAVGVRVEDPGELEGEIGKALSADAPVIIDVVSDIEALAPVAVGDND